MFIFEFNRAWLMQLIVWFRHTQYFTVLSKSEKRRLSVPDGPNGLTGRNALRAWLNLTLERGSSVGDYRGVWKLHVLSGISGTTHFEFLHRRQFDKYLGGTSLDRKVTIFAENSQLIRTSKKLGLPIMPVSGKLLFAFRQNIELELNLSDTIK